MTQIETETYRKLLKSGHNSDISFEINGKKYDLHRDIIIKSLFFKTLFDNEQHMGIKNDEIIINDIYDLPINSDYVYEVLCWLYDDDLNVMKQFVVPMDCTTTDILIKLLQYYTLSDFFQIDDLKKICIDALSKTIEKKVHRVPYRIEINRQRCGPYKHNGQIFHFGFSGEQLWNDQKEEYERFFEIIYSKFSYIKKHASKHFDHYIEKYFGPEGNDIIQYIEYGCNKHDYKPRDITKHIINSIQQNNILKFKYDDEKEKIFVMDDESGYHMNGRNFLDFLLKVYDLLYGSVADSSLWWISSDKNNNIPIELVNILMDIFPYSDSPARLLDTENWQCENRLNWIPILNFENICIHHNKQNSFKNKMKAYMEINYYN